MPPDSPGFLTCASIRRIESHWLANTAPGTLMDRAATALADQTESLLRALPAGTVAGAMAGPGNNGADALLALLKLAERGFPVRAWLSQQITGGTQANDMHQRWLAHGAPTGDLDELPGQAGIDRPLVLIDGLFGIGLSRPLDASAARIASWSHRVQHPIVAADVPSGLNPDTGSVFGGDRAAAVRASHTVTFIADKPGLHTGSGPDHAGQVTVASLALPISQFDGVHISGTWVATRLPKRHRTAHKGSFGTVAAIGGAADMPGAALLAAHGARAAGAGKVATLSPDGPVFDPGEPQLMAWSIDRPADIERHLGNLSAAAIGCGLGNGRGASNLLASTLSTDLPLVIDADALNAIAASRVEQADRSSVTDRPGAHPERPSTAKTTPAAPVPAGLAPLLTRRASLAPTILTPHPLEAARLLGQSVREIQADRIASALALAREYASVVLLKGAGTVLAAPDGRWGLITAGGPALASGGTGDVLAGLAAGLLSQSASPWEAAAVAAWIHGDAGDRWAVANPMARGLKSSELIRCIVESINHCHRAPAL